MGQNNSWSLEERQATEAGEFTTVYHIYNNQAWLRNNSTETVRERDVQNFEQGGK